MFASTGSLFIGGNVQINADAEGGTSSGNVFAIASLSAFAERDAEYDGSILVHANADDHGSGAAFAWALADLRAQSGSVIVDGNIDIAATLQGNGLEFGTSFVSSLGHFANVGFASADLEIEADDGSASLNGVSVTANANLTNPGQARSIGESSSGGARAEMNITANFGDILLRGPVSVDARARALASSLFLLASANGAIHAGEGDIALLDALSFRADARASGTEDASAEAISDVELEASGDIILPGATSRAKAVASSADFGDASAFAILSLNAGHDVDITGSGAFAGASANAPFAFDRSVTASANLQIVAGHDASIEGDVIAAAVALGGGTDNIANAIVDIEAGSGGSGDVTMSGDLAALAFADPADDHALASITVNAHNDIVIVGHDPIASAHAGTALAFLQTHVTDSQTDSGGNGSSAIARITITAGGTVSFIAPPENEINDQVLALLALPTDTPDIDPDVLTEIQLLIDGQDCGVLGSAGADPAKGAGCSKSALTIAEPDALP